MKWNDKKKGMGLVIECDGAKVRQTQSLMAGSSGVIGKTGYVKGTHSWILEFDDGNYAWSIFLVCHFCKVKRLIEAENTICRGWKYINHFLTSAKCPF